MFCLRFIIFFFSFGGDYIQTSADDVPWMMSSSANYRPFLRSFRHIPPQESFVKLANQLLRQNMAVCEKGLFDQNWVKIPGTYTSGHCKDKKSNLGPVAGYLGWNYPELSYIFVSVQNRRGFCNLKFFFCSLLKGIFNALKRYYFWRKPDKMHWRCRINKIVVTSPEAMVEFSRENIKTSALVKNPF